MVTPGFTSAASMPNVLETISALSRISSISSCDFTMIINRFLNGQIYKEYAKTLKETILIERLAPACIAGDCVRVY